MNKPTSQDVMNAINDNKPMQALYMAFFQTMDLCSEYDLHTYRTLEELYRVCLENNVTWKELLNFQGYEDNEVL